MIKVELPFMYLDPYAKNGAVRYGDMHDDYDLYLYMHKIQISWFKPGDKIKDLRSNHLHFNNKDKPKKMRDNRSYYYQERVFMNLRAFERHNYEMILWCLENCESEFGFKYSNFWYFKTNNDVFAFKLRWL